MQAQQTVTREEACRELGVSPRTFRTLWQEYASYLGQQRVPRELDSRQYGLLRVAQRLRAEGRTAEEIGAVLSAAHPAQLEQAQAQEQTLLQRLDEIAQRLSESEERRTEDRDRLLMALVRTQQEIGHLRGELASVTPRRARREWWARLFGR